MNLLKQFFGVNLQARKQQESLPTIDIEILNNFTKIACQQNLMDQKLFLMVFQSKPPYHRIHQNLEQLFKCYFQKKKYNKIYLSKLMPRAQKLSQLTPNKVYSVEGTLKFIHQSEGYTTAIIEQDSVQKKIKIPHTQNELVQGKNYKFSNCFYNSQGWLTVRKPNESIELIKPSEQQENLTQILTLEQIQMNKDELETKYLSTYLKIYSILPQQMISKNGKDIRFQVLKGYSSNRLIDVTIWNTEIRTQLFLNKQVLLQGMKTKKITENQFILVSTVFTKMSICQWEIQDDFSVDKIANYQNLSEIYKSRKLQQLSKIQIPESKIFSVVKAQVKSIVSVDYDGCLQCRRKIQDRCQMCNISSKEKYSYGKITLQDNGFSIEVIVFDEKIKQLFKFARQNCTIECQVKTFGRSQEGENVISHILTKINSVFF